MIIIKEARNFFKKELSHSPTPQLDVDCIIAFYLHKDRSWLLAHSEETLLTEQFLEIQQAIDKRKTGLPVAVIIGQKDFYNLTFYVNSDVLIPKPDTEVLVDNAIEIINKNNDISNILDLCTGSGCIALSIAHEVLNTDSRNFHFTLSDISEKALSVAKKNTTSLFSKDEQKYFTFNLANLFDNLQNQSFDLIVTNPPYVPKKIVNELLLDGRNEPKLALDGDAIYSSSDENYGDGLSIIRPLLAKSFDHLNKSGYILIETGEYNIKKTELLMKSIGFTDIFVYNDLGGQPRVIKAKKK